MALEAIKKYNLGKLMLLLTGLQGGGGGSLAYRICVYCLFSSELLSNREDVFCV